MDDLEVEFALREEAGDGDGRTIEGVAVPYNVPVKGQTKEYGSAVEYFAPGSFREGAAARRISRITPCAQPASSGGASRSR